MRTGSSTRSSRLRSLLGAGSAALAALALAAPGAQAGPLVATAPDCEAQVLEQPFLPWADPAHYTLPAGGAFEDGGAAWRLYGDAQVVSGNESYYVHGAEDSHALLLPSGSQAVSSVVCVGIEHPTVRIFAKRTGSVLTTLKVEVIFEDASGDLQAVPIGWLSGVAGWQPSVQMPVVANLLPLLPGEHTPVAFRFTANGPGEFQIDDVYVDPYKH